MKYTLTFIYFRELTQECFHSSHHNGVFRVVELQASTLGPPRFDILVLEFTKHKHTIRISYTIVIPRRNVPAVRIGLLCNNTIAVKLQKQIGNNAAFLSVQEL